MKSRKTKATDISAKVKKIVWIRDGCQCIFCGSTEAMPNAHYIPRSKGGLGIEQNVVTACNRCHYEMDQTVRRNAYVDKARQYLSSLYEDFDESKLVYRKV